MARVPPAPQRLALRPVVQGGLIGLAVLALAGAAWLLWARSTAEPQEPAGVAAAGSAIARAASDGARTGHRASLPQRSVTELLAQRSTDWQPARLRGNPSVLVIEFPNLAEQGDALNRIAALLEKTGAPRDRVLDDVALDRLIAASGDNKQTFYQGHDYSADELARFYNMAAAQGQVLNSQERRLLGLVQENHMLSVERGRVVALGLQSLITFTAVQPDDPATPMDEGVDALRRESVLRHELSHGEYLTSSTYREHCHRFWRNALSDGERALWRKYLGELHYDTANAELMVNEMQAFLMHTADERVFNPELLGVSPARLQAMRDRFRDGMPRLR